MDVDSERNCYSCGIFGHIVRNSRNQSLVGQGRRIEYKDNLNNFKEEKSLVVFDQALTISSIY